jgi:adenylate cyclase
MAQSLGMLGRVKEAEEVNREGIRRAERRLELAPRDPRALSLGASALMDAGERDRALEWSARAAALAPEDPAVLINAACTYAKNGDKEKALDYLEQSFAKGFGKRDWVENDPDYEILRDDPRFQAMLEKLK